MKRKKVMSMVFTLVMVLTLAVPAFAVVENGLSVFQATATTMLPIINVDISKTQSPILLNPYKFAVADEEDKTPSEIQGSVIAVKNMTQTDLRVSAAVTGSVSGGVSFSTMPLTSTVTAKKAFVYGVFTVQEGNDPIDDPGYNSAAANQVVVKASTVNKKNVARLPAASEREPNYLSFSVFGNCTSSPKIAWTAEDTLSVAVAYSFRMVPIGS
jgi:hypothetical protein